MSTRTRLRAAASLLAMSLVLASPAAAQEFAPSVPVPLARGAATFLDAGLPPGGSRFELSSSIDRPFGLAELQTGAVMARAGWRALRVGLGASRTGADALGWDAVGIAVGWGSATAGVGARGAARRDRAFGAESPVSDLGGEIGAGGWITSGRALVWVAHPQLATRGASPPLRRGLEFGLSWRGPAAAAWFADEAPPRSSGPETHRAGIGLGGGRGRAWIEARDSPLRPSLGVAAHAGSIGVAANVEAHPVLGESVRIELTLCSGTE